MNNTDEAFPTAPPWRCLAIPLFVAVASCGALWLVGRAGWPGEVGVSAIDFCERLRDGMVKQPANAGSNIGFVAVGLWIGWRAARDRVARLGNLDAATNPMQASNSVPTLYASLAVLLGPGSAAMHASTTRWGGTLDVMSMFIWVSFCIVYAWARLRGLSRRSFFAGYFALAGLLTYFLVARPFSLDIDVVFGLLIVTMGALELAIWWRRPEIHLQRGWLIAAAALFLTAFAIWLPSRTGGPWCDPDSLLQGHAAWHLLDAAAVACIFLYYRSEARNPVRRDDAS